MIAAGIDLGSIKPACAIVRVGDVRPELKSAFTPDYTTTPKGERRVRWHKELCTLLQFWRVNGLTHVVIEDASQTTFGKNERKVTNAATATMMNELMGQAENVAHSFGLQVVRIQPRTVSSALGIKVAKGLTEYQRRKEKKRQTKVAVGRLVIGGEGLSEDGADAVSLVLAAYWKGMLK